MAILPLKKVTVIGSLKDKEDVIKGLQIVGCVHLITPEGASPDSGMEVSEAPKDTIQALRYLNECPKKRHLITVCPRIDIEDLVKKVLNNKNRTREVADHCDFLKQRIKELEPWGDFVLPNEESLSKLRFWFYKVPNKLMRQVQGKTFPWETIFKDNQFNYVVLISSEEPAADSMPVLRSHLGAIPLSTLYEELNNSNLELEDLQAERESLTRWILMIVKNLAKAHDQSSLQFAKQLTRDTEKLFILQGWLPISEETKLMAFAREKHLAIYFEEPEAKDVPPTLLDNPKALSSGEELVKFYQTPGYKDWDPSISVFFSFSLFFAIILSDAGYSLVLGGALFGFWRYLGENPLHKKLRNLALVIVCFSVIWGILVGNYFGRSPGETNYLNVINIIDINDFDHMMRIAILIGVLHLTVANLGIATRYWPNLSAFIPLGWVGILWGGVFLWLSQIENVIPAGFQNIGYILIIGGMGAVFILSGNRKIKSPVDYFWRGLEGILALFNITRLFGDVLSYLRLFALGLASASLAFTFNSLANTIMEAIPGPGLLLAILILFLGHGLNLFLSVLGAVVHGLRLNYIEFNNWALSDEGFPFKAFKKKEITNE